MNFNHDVQCESELTPHGYTLCQCHDRLLLKVHGDRICHICKCLRREPGLPICSYPHAMIPIAPIDPKEPKGFWSWEKVELQ